MRVSRFFINASLYQGQRLNLPPHLVNYIVNVLRLKKEDQLILFNGQTLSDTLNDSSSEERLGEFTATLTEVTKRSASVQVNYFSAIKTESSLKVHLFQGLSRSERMDFTIQKAIELGISHITPVFTQRSNSGKLNAKRLEKKMLHWQGIAVSACEQSGRASIVTVNEPIQVQEIDAFNAELNLLLSPDAHTDFSELQEQSPVSVNIFIGPEGGLNDDEIEWAIAHGYQSLKLGSRILRTETAGLAILSILQFLWGDLG